jgi:hypothetical protein
MSVPMQRDADFSERIVRSGTAPAAGVFSVRFDEQSPVAGAIPLAHRTFSTVFTG